MHNIPSETLYRLKTDSRSYLLVIFVGFSGNLLLLGFPLIFPIFPIIYLLSEDFRSTYRVHPYLDIIIKDYRRSLLTPSLTETIFEDEFFWISVEPTICLESFFNKGGEPLGAWFSRTNLYDFILHGESIAKRYEKSKLLTWSGFTHRARILLGSIRENS